MGVEVWDVCGGRGRVWDRGAGGRCLTPPLTCDIIPTGVQSLLFDLHRRNQAYRYAG